jgi:hypothetical protein
MRGKIYWELLKWMKKVRDNPWNSTEERVDY